MSIRNSEKLKKILEIILAFGNYMNSGKRGSVYGFKLTSLEALVETKSTDKTQNLLHYICNVVHSYFSEFADFMLEIRYVEQAAKVSLDQVIATSVICSTICYGNEPSYYLFIYLSR